MSKIPGLIRIERRGSDFSLTVDGEEFPYPVMMEPAMQIPVASDDIPKVILTLGAHRVEVVNDVTHEQRE